MTPREEAATLLKEHGLDRALAIARARFDSDRKLRQPVERSRAVMETLDTLAGAVAALEAIERSDPVAELAARLIESGISESELQAALGSRCNSPIGNELHNKYRSIVRCGWTENHYKKRWTI